MIGSPIGIAVRDLASSGGRAALELAHRLSPNGYEPRLAVHRLGNEPTEASDGRSVEVSTVAEWPLSSWLAAYSFDRSARARLRRCDAQLIHGYGGLVVQDLLTLPTLERLRQRHVPGAPPPSSGIGYLRRLQLGPGGARAVTVFSEMARRDLAEVYEVPLTSVRAIAPGVDSRRFRPDDRGPSRFTLFRVSGWTDHYKIVLAVVTDDPATQDFSLLARAVDLLADRVPSALCVLGRVDLSKNPAVQHLARRGRFFQVPATQHVEKYFVAADVYALPAHYEEFGLPVLESLSSGTPVVVSGRTGAKEVVSNGTDGIVVDDMQDPNVWAMALERAWSLDRTVCRRSAETRPWDAHVAAIVQLYRGLM